MVAGDDTDGQEGRRSAFFLTFFAATMTLLASAFACTMVGAMIAAMPSLGSSRQSSGVRRAKHNGYGGFE
jgi:hypothetical protein